MDYVSARHKFLQGWNSNFISYRMLCAKLLENIFVSYDYHMGNLCEQIA